MSSRPQRLSSPPSRQEARLDTSSSNNQFDDNNNDEAFLDHNNNVAEEESMGLDTNGVSDSQLKGTTLDDLVPEDTDAQLLFIEDDVMMMFNEDLEDLVQVNVNDSTDSNGRVSSSNLQSGPLTSMIAFREGRDLDKKSNKKKEHSNKNPPPPSPVEQDAEEVSQEVKQEHPPKESPLVATSKKKKEKNKAHADKDSSSDDHATSKQKKDLPNKESTVNKDETTSEQQQQQQVVQGSDEIAHAPNQDENDHGDETSGQEQSENKDPQVKSSTVGQGAKDSGSTGHLGQANNNDANPYKKHNQATTTEQQAETLITDPSHAVPTRPKKPPVPQQQPDAHIQCSSDAPLFSRITCSVALATSHHPIWTTLGLTMVILLFCWRCCCRRSADHRGEYRAVAARYASDAFDDVFADNISEQGDDGFHDANGGDGDGMNGNFDEAGWSKSKKRVIEMRNLGDEENGGLTLEEMNG